MSINSTTIEIQENNVEDAQEFFMVARINYLLQSHY